MTTLEPLYVLRSAYLVADLDEWLRQEAARRGVTTAQVIREAVERLRATKERER